MQRATRRACRRACEPCIAPHAGRAQQSTSASGETGRRTCGRTRCNHASNTRGAKWCGPGCHLRRPGTPNLHCVGTLRNRQPVHPPYINVCNACACRRGAQAPLPVYMCLVSRVGVGAALMAGGGAAPLGGDHLRVRATDPRPRGEAEVRACASAQGRAGHTPPPTAPPPRPCPRPTVTNAWVRCGGPSA